MRGRVGSIFWGVILVIVGSLILARNLGYAIPIWSGLARYWPVLIIAWGFVKLIEYFHQRRTGQSRSLFSGGEVALLILVILAGTAVTTAANVGANFDGTFEFGDLDLWDVTGNNFTYDEHHDAEVPAGSTVEIVNMFGNVDIKPSDTDRVVLDVKKTVRAANQQEADRLSSDFTFSIERNGSVVRIASSQDPNGSPGQGRGRQRFKSSLTLRVPRNSMLRLDNRNGNVNVQDLVGDQNITNRYGQVDVRKVEGDLEVTNSFGELNVRDVAGAINARGRFGDIRVDLDKPPLKDVSVSQQFGDVRLRLPSDSSFALDARTSFGEVNSEFESLPDSTLNRARQRDRAVTGQIGDGGPQVHIEMRFGNVQIQKRG